MAIAARVATRLRNREEALPEPPTFAPSARNAVPPLSADYVLIEVTRSGAVHVSGMASLGGLPAYLTPPPFTSLPHAILAAHQWADAHGIGHVLLQDRTAS